MNDSLRRGFALIFLVLAMTSCGELASGVGAAGSAPAWARQSCDSGGAQMANGYGPGARLVAVFGVTGAQLAAWQERPRGPGLPQVIGSRWRSKAAESLAICYFDGTFSNLGPTLGGPQGADYTPNTPPPPFGRVIIVVDSLGEPVLYAAGSSTNIQVVDPASN